jgi:peptidoglycan/xylan/chitin deacetylase (PgdA/CDA1 family)
MKSICFRFDVDSCVCAAKGVPNLVELADRLHVKFTFFFNMGRGVHFASLLNSWVQKEKSEPARVTGDKLSNLEKLGWTGYLKTAVINPCVGKSYLSIIDTANKQGHEIGLHGGRNHGEWIKCCDLWDENKIQHEIDWGLGELRCVGIDSVNAFSSPGWQGSACLYEILRNKGFRIVADHHGEDLETVTNLGDENRPLYSIPTNLVGEPGGIGYIEHLRAKHLSDTEILEKFASDLRAKKRLAVMYDHPCFAGIQELGVLETLIQRARDMDFTVVTLSEIVR